MEITTSLPSEHKQSGHTKGYLCNKVAGDIINKNQAQSEAKMRVSQAKLGKFMAEEDMTVTAKVDSVLLGIDREAFEGFLAVNEELRG